jgi:hypothetical protein
VKYAPVESVIAVTMLEQDYTLVPSPFKKPLSHWGVQSTGRGGGRSRHTQARAQSQRQRQRQGQEREEIERKYVNEKVKVKARERESRKEHSAVGERGEGMSVRGNMVRVRAVHNVYSLRKSKESSALKRMSDVTLKVCDQGVSTLPLPLPLSLPPLSSVCLCPCHRF